MNHSGLNYLLQFSKIQKNEVIGSIEAIDFKVVNDGTQMGHLIVICKCDKHKKQFDIPASALNWKISKYLKGSLNSLDYASIQQQQQK